MSLVDLGGFSSNKDNSGKVDTTVNFGGNVNFAPFPAAATGAQSLMSLALPALAIVGAVMMIRGAKK